MVDNATPSPLKLKMHMAIFMGRKNRLHGKRGVQVVRGMGEKRHFVSTMGINIYTVYVVVHFYMYIQTTCSHIT